MKIEEIKNVICIGDIRQRMGADGSDDTSFDNDIKQMSPRELVKKWSAWTLGFEEWAEGIIEAYEDLKELEKSDV